MTPRLISATWNGLGNPTTRALDLRTRTARTHPQTEPQVTLEVATLLDHERHPLIKNFQFNASVGSVTCLSHSNPAARWTLAYLLAGRLPENRYTFRGRVAVAGRTSPAALRNLVGLAEPWHVRSEDGELRRRLRALDWAESLATPVIVLSPGFDGLAEPEHRELLDRAAELAAAGTTVVITATNQMELTGARP